MGKRATWILGTVAVVTVIGVSSASFKAAGIKTDPPVVKFTAKPAPDPWQAKMDAQRAADDAAPEPDVWAHNASLCSKARTLCEDGWVVTVGRGTNSYGLVTVPATVRRMESTPLNSDDCVSGFLTLTQRRGDLDVGTLNATVDHLCGQRAAKVQFLGSMDGASTSMVLSGSAF